MASKIIQQPDLREREPAVQVFKTAEPLKSVLLKQAMPYAWRYPDLRAGQTGSASRTGSRS
jgi:hypothetical protein